MGSRRFSLRLQLTVVTVAALLFMGVCQTPLGRSFLKDVGLIGNPDSFTSIAFTKPQSLPLQLAKSRTKLNLGFMISNHTPSIKNYDWALTVAINNKSSLVGKGHIQLAPNNTTTVVRKVEIVCKTGRAKVTVSLQQPAEHIDALMFCG